MSWVRIHLLDGHFSHLFFVKIVLFVVKIVMIDCKSLKINTKKAGDGPFKKMQIFHTFICAFHPAARGSNRKRIINSLLTTEDHVSLTNMQCDQIKIAKCCPKMI